MADTPRCRRDCPVCGQNDGLIPLYLNTMAPLDSLNMSYQVSACPGCGFIYASELPCPPVYADYYRALSKYDVLNTAAEVRPVDKARIDAAIGMCRPHLARDATIVDIGCGTGGLLHAFARAGWTRVHGIDPAPRAAEKALALFGLDTVRSGQLREAKGLLPLNTANLVCLMGVLEHLPELREDLVFLTECLAAQALILVEVPAMESFVHDSIEPYGEFSLEHIQYFSTESLHGLMQGLGYRCLASRIVRLGSGVTDSFFGLFARKDGRGAAITRARHDLREYLARSEAGMAHVLERFAGLRDRSLILYGAGSHTARLLPRLEAIGATGRIVALVDANPNLRGKTLGDFEIQPPERIAELPSTDIVISSLGAADAIESFLHGAFPNATHRLYPVGI